MTSLEDIHHLGCSHIHDSYCCDSCLHRLTRDNEEVMQDILLVTPERFFSVTIKPLYCWTIDQEKRTSNAQDHVQSYLMITAYEYTSMPNKILFLCH